ncbi:FtsX-like permease family protein [uncultured Corynebacterium sp.]|uniref:FtsX-like permease family protein n=1 Tax=uncultured Corynebacterium sp. TaxID=159447 RepID=UPI0025D68966|nr:FtsX-like permease family protein [uncultured Corynebacterium sp.]
MSTWSSFVAATRPTRRDMFRSPWRLLAAILLIALPVGFVVGNVTWSASSNVDYLDEEHSTFVDRHERACPQNLYGDPLCENLGGDAAESADTADAADTADTADTDFSTNVPTLEEFRAALPAGAQVEPWLRIDASVSATSDDPGAPKRHHWVMFEQVPDFALRESTPRLERGEVLINRSLADGLDVRPGDSITVVPTEDAPVHEPVTLRVAGFTPNYTGLIGPGTMGTAADFAGQPRSTEVSWVVNSATEWTWADVERANDAALLLSNKDWVDNPPAGAPAAESFDNQNATAYLDSNSHFFWEELAWYVSIGLGYLLGFFLILLVISPVFALAISRHTRLFALMAAQGASRKHIGWAVIVFGLIAGALGAVLGTTGGWLVGAAAFHLRYPDWHVRTSWDWTIAAPAIALVGSVLAASIPAWLAGRSSLTAAMAGGSPDKMVRWRRWMVIGPVVCAVCLVSAAALAWWDTLNRGGYRALAISLLLFFSTVGLAASAPALVFGSGQLLSRAPIAARTAGRGLNRRSMHAIPAVAALACITALLTALTVDDSASTKTSHEVNRRILPDSVVTLSTGFPAPAESDAQERLDNARARVVAAAGAPASEIEVRGVPDFDFLLNYWGETTVDEPGAVALESPDQRTCSAFDDVYTSADRADAHRTAESMPECLGALASGQGGYHLRGFESNLLVGGPELLDLVVFDSEEARESARATLEDGGIVTPKGSGFEGLATAQFTASRYVGTIDYSRNSTIESEPQIQPVSTAEAQLPVTEALSVWDQQTRLISPEAAAALKLPTVALGTALLYDAPIPAGASYDLYHRDTDEDTESAPQEASISLAVQYWNGPWDQWYLPLCLAGVALIILVLVIALGASGQRREAHVFATLGAGPRFGARVAAWQIGVIAAVALWTGILGGHLAAFVGASHNRYTDAGELYRLGQAAFVRPDWHLIVVGIAVPLLAAGVAWLVNRTTSIDAPREDRSLA